MADHQLIKYIKEARVNGASNEQIMKTLTDAGWRVHDIFDVVLEHTEPASKPADNIISVRNVSKSYGKTVKALDNVSLDVQRGGVTALLGPNGAGKTTLIRILTTLLSHDTGEANVAGLDVKKDDQKLRSIIGVTGQYAAVDEILTGRENLEMVARLYHLSPEEAKKRATSLLKRFDIDDAGDRMVRTYSGGMRRRLDLAASLIFNPQVLFLDEPTTGLDPRSRFQLWNVIRDLVKDGTTVLLTTQYLEEADRLADRIFVIDHGHIIASGTPDELKNNVGGDVLEVHMVSRDDAPRAASVIRQYGSGETQIDQESGIVSMPVSGGTSILINVVRQLDTAGIKIHDISMHRPSLDDVFMKLTGHGAE